MITYCHDCQNCDRRGKNSPPWRWSCLKHPRLAGFGFVTDTEWDDFPPHLYCKDVNGGACPLYEKSKEETTC